jgi:2-oxo-3-hexenedioate decarboxylase
MSASRAEHADPSLAALAAALDEATRSARAVPAFPQGLTLREAYAVQALGLRHRLARGERLCGVKIGLTRREKWAACGADDVILGLLTDAMRIADAGTIALDRLIAPGVEPELAFRIGAPLAGDATLEEALAAVDAVAPALEVAESRVAAPGFVLAQVVADNSNSAGFVLGAWRPVPARPDDLDGVLEVDGAVVARGNTRTVSGHPARSVCDAARLLAPLGLRLEPGFVVLSGGLAPARPVHAGEAVACRIDGVGAVSARVA